MLVLTREQGQEIVIGDSVRVVVVEIQRGKVRLGVEAPKDVSVDRKEVRGRRDFVPNRRYDKFEGSEHAI